MPRHAVQRQVAADVGLVLTSGEHTARDFGAVESDLRILGRLEDYLAQLAVYDLLLLRREHVARLFERVGAHPQVQRSRIERAGCKLRFAGKITDLDEVIVPLKKERPAGEGPHHELTPAGVQPVTGDHNSSCLNRRPACRSRFVHRAGRSPDHARRKSRA